jgi:hypothetical protein
MSKSTKAPKLKKSGPYKYFVPMSIGGVICEAMVDSCNMWKNVLSLDFLHQLGLNRDDLREVPGIQEVGRRGADCLQPIFDGESDSPCL